MRRLVRRAAVPLRRAAVPLLLGATLVPLLVGCGGDSGLPGDAVARVGPVVISQQQFEAVLASYQKAGKAPDKDRQPDLFRAFEQSVTQHLVVLEVLRQEAPAYGITITEEKIQAEIQKMRDMFQGDQTKFEAALARQKLSLADLERAVWERLLIEQMKAAITKGVSVTEDDVRAYYDAHKADYTEGEVRKARHILISPFVTAAGDEVILPSEVDWQTAKAEAERIRSEILNGADFGTAAAKYSDDKATAEDGGDLGEVTRGQLAPEFEEAVFSLRKGELSQPVRTQYGYHIIQVTDIIPRKQLAYAEVKESIRSALLAESKKRAWEDWLRERFAALGVVYRSDLKPQVVSGGGS
jgi:parvulin-like peptidyl-prolyl isomerase